RAAGLSASWGPPVHRLSSFSCQRSSPTPPNTIAPRRPFPIGRASIQRVAGFSYQSTVADMLTWREMRRAGSTLAAHADETSLAQIAVTRARADHDFDATGLQVPAVSGDVPVREISTAQGVGDTLHF